MFDGKEYVYAVYEEKSFSKAAQKLYITQPALSTAIKKVEKKIGTPIFDRSTSPIGLRRAVKFISTRSKSCLRWNRTRSIN